MYLTKVSLNPNCIHTREALENPNRFHGAVQCCLENPGRPLWTTLQQKDKVYLLVQSAEKPNVSWLSSQFGSLETPEVQDLDDRDQKIIPGSVWKFSLRANPTVAISYEKGKRGKVTACSEALQQENWLLRKAKENGFMVPPFSLSITNQEWVEFQKKGRRVIFLSVTFHGFLQVTDPELFKQGLKNGFGRQKSHGQGLLLIEEPD